MPVSPLLPLSTQFFFNVGFYMVVPFLAIFLREDLLLPGGLMVALLSLGSMIARPFVSDMVPRFAGSRPTGVYFGALASAGGLSVLVGNVAIGPLLDKALTPSPEAATPWLVLAMVPLVSALAMMVITRILRERYAAPVAA